jgi:hypothetical protein
MEKSFHSQREANWIPQNRKGIFTVQTNVDIHVGRTVLKSGFPEGFLFDINKKTLSIYSPNRKLARTPQPIATTSSSPF